MSLVLFTPVSKGTVHLIGVDMELNKENQHIAMQWNDFTSLPLTMVF
jgi:hypothetical protein